MSRYPVLSARDAEQQTIEQQLREDLWGLVVAAQHAGLTRERTDLAIAGTLTKRKMDDWRV